MAVQIDGKRYSWTQPCCDTCFKYWFPKVDNPPRLTEEFRSYEKCCQCGANTFSGLYIRIDPRTVPHPTPEAED